MAVVWKYVRQLNTGRLEFRRAFPKSLQPIVGKRELVRSLEACSFSELGAVERYQEASAEFERAIAKAHKVQLGRFDVLDAPRIAFLAECHKAAILERDERERVLGVAERERHEANELGYGTVLEDCSGPQIRDMFEDDAVELADANGWHFDRQSEAFSKLCRELLKASLKATEIQIARDNGAIVDTPSVREPPTLVDTSTIRSAAPKAGFVSLAREAMERTAFGFSETTKQATATACRFFEELHGQLPPHEIKRSHVAELIDLFARCPAKRPFAERSWTLPRLVAAYEGKNFRPLSTKTMKQHVGSLSAMWAKLQDVGKLPEGLPNPFSRHKFPKARRAEENGYTLPEVQAIFDLPLFTAGERPERSKGEALFWIPWLLLWTGARPEEIAQLLVSDFRQDEAGEWTMSITDVGDHPRKGARSLKTGDGRRTFPVPRFLLNLGLLDYRSWLVREGELALFPKLGTKGKRNELFGGFTESWGAYLRLHGVLPAGRLPARSFRHTWSTEARRCRLPEDAREYIMGHSRSHRGQNRRYGSQEPLGAEIHNVTFDKLDFTRVRPWMLPS